MYINPFDLIYNPFRNIHFEIRHLLDSLYSKESFADSAASSILNYELSNG